MSVTVDINVHRTKSITAKLSAVASSTWVDVYFTDRAGEQIEVCAFFDDPALAQAYADAINGVAAKAKEAA